MLFRPSFQRTVQEDDRVLRLLRDILHLEEKRSCRLAPPSRHD